jgi:RecA/RadA recombinase
MKTEDIKKKLKPKPPAPQPTSKDYLSTGSTLLNMALTGKPNWGYLKGLVYDYVGDSRSGKTWLCLVALAEASLRPDFQDYRLIYDNVEKGALMNMTKYFGERMVKRLEPPAMTKDKQPRYSYLLEDFYFNVWNALDGGRPFIYVLDSMDSLTSGQELEKFQERKKAREEDKETTGSMTDGKAKINSQNMRLLVGPIYERGSILLVIHQTRHRMGIGATYQPKTRGGGDAPTFYATMEIWTKVVGKITKHVNGKDRQVGNYCEAETKKDRMGGKDRIVTIPILTSSGVDDVGSCVDYLVEEKHWTKGKSGIIAPDLELEGSREKIIRHIETEGLERDVQEIVADVWDEIERQCEVQRKNRYAEA